MSRAKITGKLLGFNQPADGEATIELSPEESKVLNLCLYYCEHNLDIYDQWKIKDLIRKWFPDDCYSRLRL